MTVRRPRGPSELSCRKLCRRVDWMLCAKCARLPTKRASLRTDVKRTAKSSGVLGNVAGIQQPEASTNRPRAVLCNGQSRKACRSESSTRLPPFIKHAKHNRLNGLSAKSFSCFLRGKCLLYRAKSPTPASSRIRARTCLLHMNATSHNARNTLVNLARRDTTPL